MQEQKFTISGDIEHPEETPKKKGDLWLRFSLFLVAVAVIAGVLLFPFLQDSFPALRKLTGDNKKEVGDTATQKYGLLKKAYDSMAFVNDSLLLATKTLNNAGGAESGVTYEVQIGAFRHFDIEKYNSGMKELHHEYDNGLHKLTLGRFTDPETAKDFLKDIKEMGFKDAWIVARENGERVPFE